MVRDIRADVCETVTRDNTSQVKCAQVDALSFSYMADAATAVCLDQDYQEVQVTVRKSLATQIAEFEGAGHEILLQFVRTLGGENVACTAQTMQI